MGKKWGNYIDLPEEPNPMIKREYVKELLDSFPEELDIDWDTLKVIENSYPEEIDIDWDTLSVNKKDDKPDRWTIAIKFATK